MFNGKRIRQARELRALTQNELARRIGVTQAAIAYIEKGLKQPSSELIAKIAAQTRFPLAFFSTDTPLEFSPDSLQFRCHASLTKREIATARRYAELAYECVQVFGAQLTQIPLTLPICPREPDAAARQVRTAFMLSPDEPITNLIHVVEKSGVLVLALPETSTRLDAFSLWVGPNSTTPLIVISGRKPGDRCRYSVAHDLGHLAMVHPNRFRAEEEREAGRFAAELLLPEKAMRREILPPVTLSSIAVLKPRWGVSVQALIRRAYELNIISERQYRYLFEQLSSRGWRKKEPSNLDIPHEKPRALRQMAELVYGKPIKQDQLAADMRLDSAFVTQLLDCYAEALPPSDTRTLRSTNVIQFKRP
jgi:Zn-dependent peptidase ImmA (M78 family)/transcriptional regulator with XRE-family HTH domain